MKKPNGCGLAAGLLAGVAVAGVFWVSMLPGAPSQYGPRFPVSDEAVPANAVGQGHSGTVGFDVYTSVKGHPDIRRNEAVPVKKASAWGTSTG
jgi:hypothetical protein